MSTASIADPQQDALAPARRGYWPRMQEFGLLLVIVALFVFLSIYGYIDARPGRPNTFLNPDTLNEGVAAPMSCYAIMAIGMTCVIIAGGIDISVASIMALSALVSAHVLTHVFAPQVVVNSQGDFVRYLPSAASAWRVLPLAILLPTAVGLACGLVNGGLVVGLRIHPFIVTLGTMTIFRGMCNVLPFGAQTLPVNGKPLAAAFGANFMKLWLFGIQPMPMVVMLCCIALGWVYLRHMVAGRENYAVGGNEEAARFSGLNVNAVKLRVYAISGATAGIAGMVSLGRFGTVSTNTATGYELTVIAAAVVGGASFTGGRGTALGALLGTLVLALIEQGIQILHLNQEYKNIIIGVAIVIAVALDRLSDYLRNRRLVGAR